MSLLWLVLPLTAQSPALTHGPLLGHVDGQSMHVFARASEPGEFTLHLRAVVDGAEVASRAIAAEEHDLTLHFVTSGLDAGAAYEPRITHGGDTVFPRGRVVWSTALPDDASASTVAFGSCANERLFREQPIWGHIIARTPQALLLLGDTPYIDDGTTDGRRRRYREFLAFAPVRAALATIPTWTTWDDHDYATNDTFGAVEGSETARPVFVDYHAHASYGDGERGIYTRFRRGPIEVFVLDTRSFADTEESPLASGSRTLLGARQIGWLQRELRASTATFKVLACGMVWNAGVRPNKPDCWGRWLPERDGLFRWLGSEHLAGVVLVSGDVHRSRVILHPTANIVGYDLPEFVTSPLAQYVIAANAVAVPGLVFDAGESHSCLFLTATRSATKSTLRAVFVAGDGREFHSHELTAEQLAQPDSAPPHEGLEVGGRRRGTRVR